MRRNDYLIPERDSSADASPLLPNGLPTPVPCEATTQVRLVPIQPIAIVWEQTITPPRYFGGRTDYRRVSSERQVVGSFFLLIYRSGFAHDQNKSDNSI